MTKHLEEMEEFIKYIKSNLNEYDKINHLEKIINQHKNNI